MNDDTSLDPRTAVVAKRLQNCSRVLAVTGGKGGIGKSMIAALSALSLSRSGQRVGLFDLDLTSPCSHIILGAECGFPAEKGGILPPEVAGIKLMSVAHFAQGAPAPLRGGDLSSAMLELLAITLWGDLDVLVLDMPPGLGDTTLDVLGLIPQCEFLVVCTPSRVVRNTVASTLRFLNEQNASILGVVENMATEDGTATRKLAADEHVPFLGQVPLDLTLEKACGNCDALANTPATTAVAHFHGAGS